MRRCLMLGLLILVACGAPAAPAVVAPTAAPAAAVTAAPTAGGMLPVMYFVELAQLIVLRSDAAYRA